MKSTTNTILYIGGPLEVLFYKTYPYYGHKSADGATLEIEVEIYQDICVNFGQYSKPAREQLKKVQEMRKRAH